MKYKMIISVICIAMITGHVNAKKQDVPTPQNKDHEFEMTMLMDAPRPMFMMDHPPFMGPRVGIMPGALDRINLTDKQRKAMIALGKKHRNDMKMLAQAREDLRDKYKEKFEAILTDEQFRKIDSMRKDLRKEMKRLNEKQHQVLEHHRDDFEAILTDEQKQELQKARHDKTDNITMSKPAKSGQGNDQDDTAKSKKKH